MVVEKNKNEGLHRARESALEDSNEVRHVIAEESIPFDADLSPVLVAAINARRFKKCAATLLKSSEVANSGINASLLKQVQSSIDTLVREQNARTSLNDGDLELDELKKLYALIVPIAKSGEDDFLCEVEKLLTPSKADDVHTRKNDESIKRRASQKSKVNMNAPSVIMDDKSEPDSRSRQQDTTSAEKIQTLLQQSQDISAQELEQEQQKHIHLIGQVSELVGSLKDAALLMNKLVVEQNVQLDEMTVVAGENMTELAEQREKMKEATKDMGASIWTTIGTLGWLLCMFAITYAVMRLFPKPSSY